MNYDVEELECDLDVPNMSESKKPENICPFWQGIYGYDSIEVPCGKLKGTGKNRKKSLIFLLTPNIPEMISVSCGTLIPCSETICAILPAISIDLPTKFLLGHVIKILMWRWYRRPKARKSLCIFPKPVLTQQRSRFPTPLAPILWLQPQTTAPISLRATIPMLSSSK